MAGEKLGFRRTTVWKITRPEIQEKASEGEWGEKGRRNVVSEKIRASVNNYTGLHSSSWRVGVLPED